MAKKTTTTKKSTKSKKKAVVEEQVTPVAEVSEETSIQSAVTEEVKDKLGDAAEDLVKTAQDPKHPWYTKVALYFAAVILGGLAFLIANFGETIYTIIERWLMGLAN